MRPISFSIVIFCGWFFWHTFLVFIVFVPSRRVADYIIPFLVKFVFIPDYVFIIISLPKRFARWISNTVYRFCCRRFEWAYYRWYRTGNRFSKFFCRGTAPKRRRRRAVPLRWSNLFLSSTILRSWVFKSTSGYVVMFYWHCID